MRMLKLLVVLILAGLIGLAGYAYFGDMAPTRQEVRSPLPMDGAATSASATPSPGTTPTAPADD
ncbi:hypothetical protein PANO111632_06720 [Paracoccus nototheniae]|uniref:Uncharacterized protein n=1 Tax=Paracoccus nototheniae TaxID=2489002 RepID=A0ABW4E1V6_9RHOB|nr:hypothetical protein [Paracoccus nototheniae]